MSAFLDTDIDLLDTDRALALSPAEQAAELVRFWDGLTEREQRRFWRDASDEERDAIRASVADCLTVGVRALRLAAEAQEAAVRR